jgi:hypothetical protein
MFCKTLEIIVDNILDDMFDELLDRFFHAISDRIFDGYSTILDMNAWHHTC